MIAPSIERTAEASFVDDYLNVINEETTGQNEPVIPDIVEWAEENFYIIETKQPIVLEPHQKDILRLITETLPDGTFKWRTVLYSTVKKSGKTTISALYARWAAETWGPYQEVYNLGNKLKQAKDRAFKTAKRSIALAPEHIKNDWLLKDTVLTHLPSGSTIEALPVSGSGEAGGNQSLTVWTELWGFQYDEALLFYDELKPVLTRKRSQRFIDTYAGFEGESELLWEIWEHGLAGERLHPDIPIYGNEELGLIAYIDTGEEARRMPWQKGNTGKKYYKEQEKTENAINFKRHHLNEWATSQDVLIQMPLWDRLEEDVSKYVIQHQVRRTAVVVAWDASVSGDCTAGTVVTYVPSEDKVIELETYIFHPPSGGEIDYHETIKPTMMDLNKRYDIIYVTYDPYQLHDHMLQLSKLAEFSGITFEKFEQGADRLRSDSALVSRLKQGNFAHSGNQELRKHIQNADGKVSGNDKSIRIVKRSPTKHVDGAVSLSMAAWKISEVMELHNVPPAAQIQIKGGIWGKK